MAASHCNIIRIMKLFTQAFTQYKSTDAREYRAFPKPHSYRSIQTVKLSNCNNNHLCDVCWLCLRTVKCHYTLFQCTLARRRFHISFFVFVFDRNSFCKLISTLLFSRKCKIILHLLLICSKLFFVGGKKNWVIKIHRNWI